MVGFAGTAADCIAIIELLAKEIERYPGQTLRACLSLAQMWRQGRMRKLEGSVIVTDPSITIMMDGSGNCIEVENGVVAIGSGGHYALSAALGMLDDERMTAENVCHRAMKIAADLCVFTNHNTMLKVLNTD